MFGNMYYIWETLNSFSPIAPLHSSGRTYSFPSHSGMISMVALVDVARAHLCRSFLFRATGIKGALLVMP